MLFMYFELIQNSLGLFWDDLEAIRENSIEILKFYKICIHWSVSRPITILSPMISFESSDHFESGDHFESNNQFWV